MRTVCRTRCRHSASNADERVAIVLPQCPETAITHIAVYQMGAVAMPLSLLFGPDALEYRLQDSEAVVAIVDASALASIDEVHARCPNLRHLIVVGESSTQRGLARVEQRCSRAIATLTCRQLPSPMIRRC